MAATILIALGAVVRWGLGFLGTPFLPFTTFFPAVLFATYIGGLRVGIFAAIFGGLNDWGAFMLPHWDYFYLTRATRARVADLRPGVCASYLGGRELSQAGNSSSR